MDSSVYHKPSGDLAIKVDTLSKVYHLFDSPKDRIKEALHPWRKKFHKDFYALDKVSFEVHKGETFGIIGQNGGGKSTLLKIISSVLSPSGGSCTVNGTVSSLLELGTGFNPDLTGMDNVYFYATLLGFTKDEIDAKIDEILEFADIGEFIKQPVRSYSSGMYVRLAFAVAVQVNPDILIIDEALSVGDIRFQQKCYRKMRGFKDENKTIILVTHDTGAILNLCTTCLWLSGGKVRGLGDPKLIVKNYTEYMNHGQESWEGEKENNNRIDAMDTELDNREFIPWDPINRNTQFGEGGAEITDIAFFMTDSREKIQRLRGGETVTLGMKIKVTEELENPIVGFAVKNEYGVNVFGTNTFQENKTLEYLSKPDHSRSVFFTFPFPPLGNGKYLIEVAIADGTQHSHSQKHSVYDAITFDINNFGDKYSYGYVFLKDVQVTPHID